MSPEGGGERRRLDINSLKTEAEIEAAFLALDKEEAVVGEELAGVLGRQVRLDQRLRGVLALAPRSTAADVVGKCAGPISFTFCTTLYPEQAAGRCHGLRGAEPAGGAHGRTGGEGVGQGQHRQRTHIIHSFYIPDQYIGI